MKKFLFILCALVLAISACTPATVPAATQAAPANSDVPAGYPPVEAAAEGDFTGYPSQDGGEQTTLITNPVPPTGAPEPEPGMASISGVLYSFTSNRVLVETSFYLTPAIGENKETINPGLVGPRDENGDIRAVTNDQGQYEVNNIRPGNYFIIVMAPYSWVPVVEAGNYEKAQLIKLNEGDRLELGVSYLSWP